jgi:hypothetical protein
MLHAERLDQKAAFLAYQSGLPSINARFGVLRASGSRSEVGFDDPHNSLYVSADDAAWLLGLFPESAQTRVTSVLRRIKSESTAWFSVECKSNVLPSHTTEPAEALSPTALVFGGTAWIFTDRRAQAEISLFALPNSAGVGYEARRVAQVKTIVHELAHTILTAEFWLSNAGLKVPDGAVVPALDFLLEFAASVQKYPPISRYSSAYRDHKGGFLQDPNNGEVTRISIEEELAEEITAHLLGFVVDAEGQLSFRPFEGRGATEQTVSDYLNAERLVIGGQ